MKIRLLLTSVVFPWPNSNKKAGKRMNNPNVQTTWTSESNDISNVLRIRKKKNGYELVREKHKSSYKNKSIPFKVRETVVKYQGDLHESIYIDIGKQVDDLESEIIKLSQEGLDRDNIRDNTYKTHGQHYNNKKSFNVVFGRKWNSLLNQGFIHSGQQDNT